MPRVGRLMRAALFAFSITLTMTGRFVTGVGLTFVGRPSVGGEIGGIGNDFLNWSVRARGAVPF
jgi:hypothetical protein